ncbi:MAG: HupE/UreJ family protein, partial [Steroidobacteraceae bacterium]
HEVRPAYLEVVESSAGEFAVTWKVPAMQEGVLAVTPDIGSGCSQIGERRAQPAPGALVTRWQLRCAEGLGDTIQIVALDRTLTSTFVRVRWLDGRELQTIVTGARPLVSLEDDTPAAAAYLRLGIEHIIGGIDHLAFIVGLVLIVTGWRRLVLTLTAFTLAHSLTLGAAALGFVGLPQRPVEVLIAFSIAVVAREAYFVARGTGGFTARAPWIVAFGFGLLHGFGFAGALGEIGLPQDAKILALVLFNVGVEVGQILAVLVLVPLLAAVRRYLQTQRSWIEAGASVALGGVAVYWVCERMLLPA